jgi:cytidylate kinase
VYLRATPETRARRIQKREGGSLDAIAAFTAERDRQDHGRYRTLYGIDTDEYAFVDLIIDVDNLTPEAIMELVIEALKKKCGKT